LLNTPPVVCEVGCVVLRIVAPVIGRSAVVFSIKVPQNIEAFKHLGFLSSIHALRKVRGLHFVLGSIGMSIIE
jgi:hypothetical protein